MKIRLVKPHDENPAPMVFVEIEPETWLEINHIPEFDEYFELLKDIKTQQANRIFSVTYHSRAFRIWSTLQNYFEIELIAGWD